MATITPSITASPEGSHKVFIATWASMANSDVGEPIPLSQYSDRSVQVAGVLAGGSVTMEGSLNGVDYSVLTDPQGNNLVLTTQKIEMVTELVRFLRPVVSSGAGTTVSVTLLLRLT